MAINPLLEQSSRVALAAFLRDLGKFAERAKLTGGPESSNANTHLYCPHRTDTALAMDLIEDFLPDSAGADFAPFGSWKTKDADDSFIDVTAMRPKPETFLQGVMATADRLASGFDREEFERDNAEDEGSETGINHYTARQVPLFEQIRLHRNAPQTHAYRYPLKPLSPNSIFPVQAAGYESNDNAAAQQEYHALWQGFTAALGQMPKAHRANWPLWLDHFETLWCVYAQAIPAATALHVRPEVSLYDHSRVTAALATALWRYHHERGDAGESAAESLQDPQKSGDKNKLLLIQGDFFGIQDFIFASGGETGKRAATLPRGRAFYVSLLTECAALKVLDTLDLPPTSQVINAAGKFMIVAHNSPATRETLHQAQSELDAWFLEHGFGQAGVGLAWTEASGTDFRRGKDGEDSPYRQLIAKLCAQLDVIKNRRFDLCAKSAEAIVFDGFLDRFDNTKGVCKIDGRSPATEPCAEEFVCQLAKDQLDIGAWLVNPNKQRILISRESLTLGSEIKIPIFGYHIAFADPEDKQGKFGEQAKNGNLLRAWDFSLPASDDQALWNGYARRNINAYVPIASVADKRRESGEKYIGIEEKLEVGAAKTLHHLACGDRKPDPERQDKWLGISALSTLKGDVDNLGLIFEKGLGNAISFSKTAALSRQMHAFFTVYLPWLCHSEFEDSYTVFAGGDDFFLIGPWLSQIKLASKLRQAFQRYVAHNPEVHFCAGISTTPPGLPITQLGDLAEDALEQAKTHNPDNLETTPKNAVSCFNRQMSWQKFAELTEQRLSRLQDLCKDNNLSTGYVHGLLNLIEMAEKVDQNPENALWRSYFAYRTARLLERKPLNKDQRKRRQAELAEEIAHAGIIRHGGNYRVTLYCHLYQQHMICH